MVRQTYITAMQNKSIRKKIFDYFQIAAQVAQSKDDERSFLLGAIGIRADGVMVSALNGPSQYPNRVAHAEARLARKLTPNSEVYVVRVRLIDGQFGMARPCEACQKILRTKGIKRVYYSIGPDEFGIMNLCRKGVETERVIT